MKEFEFASSEQQLQEITANAVTLAQKHGAQEAAANVTESISLEVDVRQTRPEAIQFNQQIHFSVRVLLDNQSGSASCNSLAVDDIELATIRSIAIARQMQPDKFEGFPAPDQICTKTDWEELDLYHPWRPEIGELVRLSKQMNEASWAVDGRISQEKSEGSGVSTNEIRTAGAASNGFSQAMTGSMHTYGCAVIAELAAGMETAYWSDTKRKLTDLEDHIEIANKAARRAVARDEPKPLAGGNFPVIFESGVSHSLIRIFLQGISGDKVWRKLTCFKDQLDQQIWSDHVFLRELPLVPRGLGSSPFDGEGVKTKPKDIVANGVLSTFLLDCYSARRLKLASTGNAGGVTNLAVEYKTQSFDELLRQMDTGLLVTDLMGSSGDLVTGDYSSGASGFWVKDGQIEYPVRDATIAGNIKEMFANIVAGGDDYRVLGGKRCGSLLVEKMSLAGNAS